LGEPLTARLLLQDGNGSAQAGGHGSVVTGGRSCWRRSASIEFEQRQESPVKTSSTTTSQEVLSLLRQHGPLLRERYGVTTLRVFGSMARGTATPTSDLDLLVRFDAPATARRFYGLQVFLEDLLGRHVDLVTEKALREEFRHRVEADAIAI
jgi:uncharacterized protein